MDLVQILGRLGIAAALGLLVGLQRQRARAHLAGIRTFALITMFGTVCGLLASSFGGWVVGAGLLSLSAMLLAGNIVRREEEGHGAGTTTEVTGLVMYALGAYLVVGPVAVAVVAVGAVAILLHLKKPLHDFVQRMGPDDVTAIMQFTLISLVILPVLPDRSYPPFDALNPREIWWMVVLIVGMSLGGYVAYKLAGGRAGTLVGGAIGGLISSTAATISAARRAAAAPESADLAAAAIMIASTVAFARVLVEVAAAAPGAVREMAPPLIAMAVLMVLLSLAWFLARRLARRGSGMTAQGNPAELRSALVFAALYALVLVVVAAVKSRFGDRALYAVAAVSGLTDMDAITLSSARFVEKGQIPADQGWRLIVVASLANLAFKGASAALLGGRALGARVATLFALAGAGGAALLVFWP